MVFTLGSFVLVTVAVAFVSWLKTHIAINHPWPCFSKLCMCFINK